MSVHGLELPGFDGAEPPLEAIEAIVDRLADQVGAVAPEGPLALLGYSMGGVVAYEMARRLEAAGRSVVYLGLLDTLAPNQMRRRPKGEVFRVWRGFLLSGDRPCRIAALRERLRLSWSRMTSRPRRDGRRMATLGREDPTRDRRDYESVAMDALWAATLKASRCYRPTPLQKEIWLFRSTLGAVLAYPPEDLYGQWEALAPVVRTITVPGSHLDMLRDPAASIIARSVIEALGGASLDANWCAAAPAAGALAG